MSRIRAEKKERMTEKYESKNGQKKMGLRREYGDS